MPLSSKDGGPDMDGGLLGGLKMGFQNGESGYIMHFGLLVVFLKNNGPKISHPAPIVGYIIFFFEWHIFVLLLHVSISLDHFLCIIFDPSLSSVPSRAPCEEEGFARSLFQPPQNLS